MNEQETHHNRRFGGVARLYGEQGLDRLTSANIAVIGVGGVGSWVVESLARSAIGKLTLIDLDVVAVSNINRQILATSDVIGRDKTDVMKQRVSQINPECQVTIIDDFLTRENVKELVVSSFDFVIDCIDDFRTKAALIAHCKRNKIKIITTGGAGGQVDPSKIRQCDLSQTQHDVLLAKTRKLLRQEYGFARNLDRRFSIPCIYSDEQLVYPNGAGGTQAQRPVQASKEQSNALNCAGGLGSITHVTATFGLFCAAYVCNYLAKASSLPTE